LRQDEGDIVLLAETPKTYYHFDRKLKTNCLAERKHGYLQHELFGREVEPALWHNFLSFKNICPTTLRKE
jgi:hypothetical protein